MDRAAQLAEAFGAHVLVVSAVPALAESAAAATGDPLWPSDALAGPVPEELAGADAVALDEGRRRLEEPIARLRERGVSADPHVGHGDPVDEVEGRSKMSKSQLQRAVAAKKARRGS